MSKARLVITAVVVEHRSQSEVAREYGVSQSWVSKLVARYRRDGDAAFEPRSRRPHTSPARLPAATIELILTLRTTLTAAGPHTIAWHLRHHPYLTVSVASIHRHLTAAALVRPSPANGPSPPTSASAEQPTNDGNPTSPTGGSPGVCTPKS